jgi:O-antigen/teichoic acid export membrane protein
MDSKSDLSDKRDENTSGAADGSAAAAVTLSPLDSQSSPTASIERSKRLGSGLLWGQAGRVLDIGLATVFSLLVIRALGPAQYAIWAVAWSIIGTVTLLTSLGYTEMLQRFVPAMASIDRERAHGFARTLLVERVIISLLAAFVVVIARAPIVAWMKVSGLAGAIWISAGLLALQGVCDLLSGYYSASLRMRAHTIVRVSGHALAIVTTVVLFAATGVHTWVPLVAMAASLVLSLVLYLRGATAVLRAPSRVERYGQQRKYGAVVWLSSVATYGLSNHLGVLMIASLLADAVQTSYYNVVAVFLSRLQSTLTGWSVVIIPHAAEVRARGGLGALAPAYGAFTRLSVMTLTPAFVFAAVWAAPVIGSVLGTEYLPAANLLTLSASFGIASSLLGAHVRLPLLYVADRQRALLGLRIGAGLLNIAANALLIPRYGATGAVLSSGISNVATHLAEFGLFHRTVSSRYPVVFVVRIAASCALAAGVSRLVTWPGLGGLLAGLAVFMVVLVLCLVVQRPLASAEYDAFVQVVPKSRGILRWFTRKDASDT